MRRVLVALLPFVVILSACTAVSQPQSPESPSALNLVTASPTIQSTRNPTVSPILPSLTSEPSQTSYSATPTRTVLLWVAPFLPKDLLDNLYLEIGSLPPVQITERMDSADIRLQVSNQHVLAEWVYALVTPFPSLVEGITIEEILDAWNGTPTPQFSNQPLLLDEITLALFSSIWGDPVPEAVSVHPSSDLLEFAWENQPAWGLIPFEDLEPRWKVLEVDGQSPIRKDFESMRYPLNIPFGLTGELDLIESEGFEISDAPTSNRLDDKLTTLSLTGVTALVRGTALTMESRGITYPAEDIGNVLRASDLTHINNEIPFSSDCPFPELYPSSLVFCSAPEYIGLLEEIGTDLVELSGDHFGDYGPEAMINTLDMYAQRGWQVYGGGENAEHAREPVLIEHNSNRIALLGCNIGCEIKTEISCKALAQDDSPGAAACDFDWMENKIRQLTDQDYSVVVTFQHKEYFTYIPQPDLVRDFGRAAEAGAVIVSGSQAHQPHGMAFGDDTFIHYGLGNLFFDQYNYCAENACNYGFIDRHIFYDGRYISTELLTIRFVDMARPRLMSPEERLNFLDIIFQASGW